MSDEQECAGKLGQGGCSNAVKFIVGGDPACDYHLGSLVRVRLRETRGPVEVAPKAWVEP